MTRKLNPTPVDDILIYHFFGWKRGPSAMLDMGRKPEA